MWEKNGEVKVIVWNGKMKEMSGIWGVGLPRYINELTNQPPNSLVSQLGNLYIVGNSTHWNSRGLGRVWNESSLDERIYQGKFLYSYPKFIFKLFFNFITWALTIRNVASSSLVQLCFSQQLATSGGLTFQIYITWTNSTRRFLETSICERTGVFLIPPVSVTKQPSIVYAVILLCFLVYFEGVNSTPSLPQ